jgi:hypothetical protein
MVYGNSGALCPALGGCATYLKRYNSAYVESSLHCTLGVRGGSFLASSVVGEN